MLILDSMDQKQRLQVNKELTRAFSSGEPDDARPVSGVPEVQGFQLPCGVEVLYEMVDGQGAVIIYLK